MSSVDFHEGQRGLSRRMTRHERVANFDDLYSNNKYGKIDNPIRYIPVQELEKYLEPLRKMCNEAMTMPELVKAAKLAQMEHALDLGLKLDTLEPAEREALKIQRSSKFWKEPKDLLMTLAVCCMASAIQGWDQMANGNFGWPDELKVPIDPDRTTTRNLAIFAAVQAVPWFSAAILGSWLSDPLSEYIGRRKALFVAGLCSLTGSVWGSRATSWQMLLGTRVVLGLGIGGKASIVPVLESEVLPSSKRGRLLVSWQAFTATGLFAGSVASYILRGNWRNQYLSGAIPALILLVAVFTSCESPRWLMIRNQYEKAFLTLVRLRKERVLAAKELASIHYQIQAERAVFLKRNRTTDDSGFDRYQRKMGRSSYWQRLYNMFMFPRIRRAATSATIVMLAQQLSGINILAFLATQFYSALAPVPRNPTNEVKSYWFAIGFGLTNMLFSILAYVLVENRDPSKQKQTHQTNSTSSHPAEDHGGSSSEPQMRDLESSTSNRSDSHTRSRGSSVSEYRPQEPDRFTSDDRQRFRGRRFLLLTSLASGAIILLLTACMFAIPASHRGLRNGFIIFFTILFTMFYSPGAGAIPFLYCAEIFPNEGRELGMSWSTFVNFFAAGCLALGVPFGFRYDNVGKLLGIFAGFNLIAFVLVFLFVPGTNQTATLEDMSCVFGRSMRDHASSQIKRLRTLGGELGPRLDWPLEEEEGDASIAHYNHTSHENETNGQVFEMTEQNGRQDRRNLPESPQVTPYEEC